MTRRYGISEARRRLPELVRSVAAGGGRVDITYRGKPQVALLRVSDVKHGSGGTEDPWQNPALRGEIRVPRGDLIAAIRKVRRTMSVPNTDWLDPDWGAPPSKTRRPRKPRKRRARTRGP